MTDPTEPVTAADVDVDPADPPVDEQPLVEVTFSDHHGPHQPGDTVELPEREARRLVKARRATTSDKALAAKWRRPTPEQPDPAPAPAKARTRKRR